MSEQSPTPGQNEDPAIPMNPGANDDAGGAASQIEDHEAISAGAPQNLAAVPEASIEGGASHDTGNAESQLEQHDANSACAPQIVATVPEASIEGGASHDTGNAESQLEQHDANSAGAPHNVAAVPEATGEAGPVCQGGPGEIVNVNTSGSVAHEQCEPTTPVLPPGQDIEQNPHVVVVGTASSSPHSLDELPAEAEYSLTERLLDAIALVSHDEYLGMGDYANVWDPDVDLYEPCESLDLVKKKGSINVSLVDWKGHRARFRTFGWEVTFKGEYHRVPGLPTSIYNAMHLPTNVTSSFSAGQIFKAICHVLRGCPALSGQQCELLSFWCMATWFADQMDFIPRMTITGPRYAADLLFELLSCVCRRAILLAGIKPATLQQIPIKDFMPTLLIRQIKPGKSASELLDASDRRRYFVPCGKELRGFYCAKCVYVGEQYDATHVGNGLYIHLGRNAPSANAGYPTTDQIEHLQNQLFTYRSFYLDRFEREAFQVPRDAAFLLQLNMIAYRLCSVIFEDCELQGWIIDLLKIQNEQIRVDAATGIEATVLKSVLSHCHENESQVYIRNIAATANSILLEQGETCKLSNEKVGHVLKRLGLYSRRLGFQGRGLELDKAQQERVHQLALDYDVLPSVPGCGYCYSMQALPS